MRKVLPHPLAIDHARALKIRQLVFYPGVVLGFEVRKFLLNSLDFLLRVFFASVNRVDCFERGLVLLVKVFIELLFAVHFLSLDDVMLERRVHFFIRAWLRLLYEILISGI